MPSQRLNHIFSLVGSVLGKKAACLHEVFCLQCDGEAEESLSGHQRDCCHQCRSSQLYAHGATRTDPWDLNMALASKAHFLRVKPHPGGPKT